MAEAMIYGFWDYVTGVAISSLHFLILLTLGEASCHVMKILKEPCGEVHMERNCGLPPIASKELRPSAKSHVHKPSWNQIPRLSQAFR